MIDDEVCPICHFYMTGARGTCPDCGGTGDAYDRVKNDWVSPRKKCETCNGTGECH